MTVIDEIAAERKRQAEVEGWDASHDDAHDAGELAAAACCYADVAIAAAQVGAVSEETYRKAPCPHDWPWADHWWKPKNARRDLVRAAALIVAEIERLDRKPMNDQQRGGK